MSRWLDSREGYDLYGPEYRKDHPHLDSFDWDTAGSWVREILATNPRAAVLDLGCGDGRVLRRLARWGVGFLAGADISPVMIRLAKKRCPEAFLGTLDLRSEHTVRPFLNDWGRKADLVLSFFVLVHLPDPSLFFQALDWALSPGGVAVFNSIPQPQPPELEAQGRKFRIQAFDWDRDQILRAVEVAGFSQVRCQDLLHQGELVSTLFWIRRSDQGQNSG